MRSMKVSYRIKRLFRKELPLWISQRKFFVGPWWNWNTRLIQTQDFPGSNPGGPTIMGRYA